MPKSRTARFKGYVRIPQLENARLPSKKFLAKLGNKFSFSVPRDALRGFSRFELKMNLWLLRAQLGQIGAGC